MNKQQSESEFWRPDRTDASKRFVEKWLITSEFGKEILQKVLLASNKVSKSAFKCKLVSGDFPSPCKWDKGGEWLPRIQHKIPDQSQSEAPEEFISKPNWE